MSSDHSDEAQRLIEEYQSYGNDFTPDYAVQILRDKTDDDAKQLHVLYDLIEGLWDEVKRLRTELDQSKAKRGSTKNRRPRGRKR